MYKILTVQDEVRVPPMNFNMDVKDAIKKSLQEQIEGKINPDIGVFLCVININDVREGRIVPGDGAIFYPTEYDVLVFKPEDQEVIPGEAVDITEFGVFTRIGPIDGLVHVSQVMDDKMSYDSKNATLTSRAARKSLKEGDIVRVRAVGVSLGKAQTKISLTMRQPGLGSMKWIEDDKRTKKGERKAEKPEKKEKKKKGEKK